MSSVVLAVSTLVLAGCHPAVTDPKDPKYIVAEKGDWKITRAQLDEQMGSFLKQQKITSEQVGADKMLQLQSMILDGMVIQKLLLEKAATMPLPDVDKDEATALDQIKQHLPPGQTFEQQLAAAGLTPDKFKEMLHERIVVQKVIESQALTNTAPTDQEINDFYLKNKARFVVPSKVRASRVVILVDAKTSPADKAVKKKAIDKALARVVKGEDFSKVAQEVSEDRYSAPKGGDVGFFQQGENEPPFDDIAFHTKVGAVSPVFETAMGYEFLKVTDSHPGSELSIAEAREYISHGLTQMKQQQKVEAYTRNLLATGGVTFHLVRIDPGQPAGGNAGVGSTGAIPPPPTTVPPPPPPSSTPPPAPSAPPK